MGEARRPKSSRISAIRRGHFLCSGSSKAWTSLAFTSWPATVFDLAFQKGKGARRLQGSRGQTIVLGSAGWQAITNPMLAAAGVDPESVKYVEAGGFWGKRSRRVRPMPRGVGRLRANGGPGPRLRLPAGKNVSTFPANSYVTRKSDLPIRRRGTFYTAISAVSRWSTSFGHINPRLPCHIVMEQFPGLKTQCPGRHHRVDDADGCACHAKWGEERQSMWGYHLLRAGRHTRHDQGVGQITTGHQGGRCRLGMT